MTLTHQKSVAENSSSSSNWFLIGECQEFRRIFFWRSKEEATQAPPFLGGCLVSGCSLKNKKKQQLRYGRFLHNLPLNNNNTHWKSLELTGQIFVTSSGVLLPIWTKEHYMMIVIKHLRHELVVGEYPLTRPTVIPNRSSPPTHWPFAQFRHPKTQSLLCACVRERVRVDFPCLSFYACIVWFPAFRRRCGFFVALVLQSMHSFSVIFFFMSNLASSLATLSVDGNSILLGAPQKGNPFVYPFPKSN